MKNLIDQIVDLLVGQPRLAFLGAVDLIQALPKDTFEDPRGLIFWSGRPDSNRRRPAWEIDCRLKIKDNSVYGVNERR